MTAPIHPALQPAVSVSVEQVAATVLNPHAAELSPAMQAFVDLLSSMQQGLDNMRGSLQRRPADPEAVPTDLTGFFRWVVDVLFYGLHSLAERVTILEAGQQALSGALAAQVTGAAVLRGLVDAAQADATASLRNDQALTAGLAANAAADHATAQQVEADRLAVLALQAYQQSSAADLALLKAQRSQDAATIVAAQQAADAAATRATTAINNAAAAQAAATGAGTSAAAAQQAATAAQVTADQAKATASNLLGRFRRFDVATPATTLSVTTPMLVPVALPSAYADAEYSIALAKQGTALLGVDLGYTERTGAGFKLELKNLGTVALAVGASTVTVFTYRNG